MAYTYTQPYTAANIIAGSTSTSDSVFTIGVNGTSATDVWTNTSWSTAPVTISQKATIDLKGDDADVVINGVSLSKTLSGIQERLGLLEMNPALENEFDELRAAANHYRELEKRFKEQKQVWETLKKQDL
jgi:hypothetical protein